MSSGLVKALAVSAVPAGSKIALIGSTSGALK